jgi:phage shock protein PspC (stress-responsive transcriptional regulator)
MNFKKYFSDKNEPLTKCDENSIIDGVCSGIAKRYGIDALWLRLAFICGLFL